MDPNFIRRAQDHLSFQRSRSKPCRPPGALIPAQLSTRTINYFPVSSVLDHGHRTLTRLLHSEPLNSRCLDHVHFRAEDWGATVEPSSCRHQRGRFDTILALSVVKWIHLNHRDHGLRQFFSRCYTCLRPGGYLVLELQPWTSYEKAIKSNKAPHLAGNLAKLQTRPEDFGSLLEGLGFLESSTSDELPRPIYIYQKLVK